MEFHHRESHAIKSLIELGTQGYFPLFENSWIEESTLYRKNLTGNEKVKAKKLFTKVSQHRSIERKKTVLLSMEKNERKLFIKAFFKMVENKILDQRMELH